MPPHGHRRGPPGDLHTTATTARANGTRPSCAGCGALPANGTCPSVPGGVEQRGDSARSTMPSQQTFIVTGAASGIGHATAVRLIERGHRVLSLDLKRPTAD